MASWHYKDMGKVKTTIRLDSELKKIAEHRAIDEGTSLQFVVNVALERYLKGGFSQTPQQASTPKSVDVNVAKLDLENSDEKNNDSQVSSGETEKSVEEFFNNHSKNLGTELKDFSTDTIYD